MIRQAISCDICGAEKKQTNHWFVACELAGELRVSGWNTRNRLRAGSKHLCGQTCLHKLVDEFMARTIAGRLAATPVTENPVLGPPPPEPVKADRTRSEMDASLTSRAAYAEIESSGRLVTSPAASVPAPRSSAALVSALPAVVVSMPARSIVEPPLTSAAAPPVDDPPAFSSRRWRAEAWERERSRELRAVERHPDNLRQRKGR